jgi:hypothetical protein
MQMIQYNTSDFCCILSYNAKTKLMFHKFCLLNFFISLSLFSANVLLPVSKSWLIHLVLLMCCVLRCFFFLSKVYRAAACADVGLLLGPAVVCSACWRARLRQTSASVRALPCLGWG